MPNFNKLIFIGHLTRDPETRTTPKGTSVGRVTLACNREWSDKATKEKKQEVTFADFDLFGKNAENVGKYMRKGSCMLVEARLQNQEWTDKTSGEKRHKVAFIAEQVQFLSSPKREEKPEPRVVEDDAPASATKDGDDVPF